MANYPWLRRGIVAGLLLIAGTVVTFMVDRIAKPGAQHAAATADLPVVAAIVSLSPDAEAAPVTSKVSVANAPASVEIPPAETPIARSIRMIQDQAARTLAANPAVEPHDATGGPPAFPVGFDFDAARPPANPPGECTQAKRIICVDKTTYIATIYEKGEPLWSFYVRPGDARGTRYQTGEGYGRITYKSRNHVSSIYGTPMPYAMFISWDKQPVTGQAFHLSYQFQSEGYYGASHGCMGVGSEAAMKRLWDTAPSGTRVFVYRT